MANDHQQSGQNQAATDEAGLLPSLPTQEAQQADSGAPQLVGSGFQAEADATAKSVPGQESSQANSSAPGRQEDSAISQPQNAGDQAEELPALDHKCCNLPQESSQADPSPQAQGEEAEITPAHESPTPKSNDTWIALIGWLTLATGLLCFADFYYFFSDFGPLRRAELDIVHPEARMGLSLMMLSRGSLWNVVLLGLMCWVGWRLARGISGPSEKATHLLGGWILLTSVAHRAPFFLPMATHMLALGALWCAGLTWLGRPKFQSLWVLQLAYWSWILTVGYYSLPATLSVWLTLMIVVETGLALAKFGWGRQVDQVALVAFVVLTFLAFWVQETYNLSVGAALVCWSLLRLSLLGPVQQSSDSACGGPKALALVLGVVLLSGWTTACDNQGLQTARVLDELARGFGLIQHWRPSPHPLKLSVELLAQETSQPMHISGLRALLRTEHLAALREERYLRLNVGFFSYLTRMAPPATSATGWDGLEIRSSLGQPFWKWSRRNSLDRIVPQPTEALNGS